MTVKYISFSSWKDWHFCPFKFKITRVDGNKLFEGNEYSTFGTAVHDTSEQLVILENQKMLNEGSKDEDSFDPIVFFEKRFKEELENLPKEKRNSIPQQIITEMKKQGRELVPLVLPALKEHFGEYELFQAEYELRQPIDKHTNYDFYGFVDLIIKTKSDGKYHIIDWKTTTAGWFGEKRTEKETIYQLTFYKHFLSKQLKIEPKMIETYFGLLKRKNVSPRIEIFRVTNGEKRIKNALDILNNCVTNIEKKNFIKNKLKCSKCEFNKTIYCP